MKSDRLPPGGADHRRGGQPQPAVDLRNEHQGNLVCAGSGPPLRVPAAGHRGLVGQGLRRTDRNCPTPRTPRSQGRHPYDVSKSCADLLALTYHQTYDLPVCVTRCGNFFGGGDLNWNRIVPGTIRAVLRGQRPVIRSDGTFVRDYFYVKDGAAAYLHLAECMARRPEVVGQAFNFSNEIQVTVLDLVSRILRQMQSTLEPDVRGEASHEIKHQYLSAAKARRMLAWSPRYALDEALRETIAWYRDYFASLAGGAAAGNGPIRSQAA